MVACISRSTNVHEKHYPAWKGELLAAVWGINSFRHHLLGSSFALHTDHRPLLWMLQHPDPQGQFARWILSLQAFDFTVVHTPGRSNPADFPSRNPLPSATDRTGVRVDEDSDPAPALPAIVDDGGVPILPASHDNLAAELDMLGAAKIHMTAAGRWASSLAASPSPSMSVYATELHTLTHSCAAHAPIDSVAPTPEQLLGGEMGYASDPHDWSLHAPSNVSAAQQLLAARADGWVSKALRSQPGLAQHQPGSHPPPGILNSSVVSHRGGD